MSHRITCSGGQWVSKPILFQKWNRPRKRHRDGKTQNSVLRIPTPTQTGKQRDALATEAPVRNGGLSDRVERPVPFNRAITHQRIKSGSDCSRVMLMADSGAQPFRNLNGTRRYSTHAQSVIRIVEWKVVIHHTGQPTTITLDDPQSSALNIALNSTTSYRQQP